MVCPSLARTPIQPLPGGASKYNTHILSWVHCGSILCCGWLAYCVLQWVAVSCSVLQCVAVCCSVLWMTSILCCDWVVECVAIEWCIVLCLCCSELQWVAVSYSELQCVAVSCSVLQLSGVLSCVFAHHAHQLHLCLGSAQIYFTCIIFHLLW